MERSNRERLQARLRAARARTDALFEWLEPTAFLERPIAERHRLIFYVGHLEAFDWNLLARQVGARPARNEPFERLFAFGIDPLDGNLPRDTPLDWPALEVLRAWGHQARADVDEVLAHHAFTGWLEDGWAAHLAIEHRLMHAETLAYLFNRLPLQSLRAGPAPAVASGAPGPAGRVRVPAGRVTLGLSRSAAPRLGWDNEYEAYVVEVEAFLVEAAPVTNAEYLRFVEAGGYRERRLWSDADWAWLKREDVTHPGPWRARDGGWAWRAMFAEVALPLSWPVYVSHAEAAAFAAWRGGRLMTEAEWHRAALGTTDGAERVFPWGEAAPVAGVHGNFGFSSFDPAPVGSHPAGTSDLGVQELMGNGWEWTSTPFAPFEGFEPLPFYRGYSADFFDGRHFVLKGASPHTDVSFLRRSFRNWFQPHYPHVPAKFRCVFEAP